MNKKSIKNITKSLLFFAAIGVSVLSVSNKNVKADNENLEEKLFKRIEISAGVNNLEKVKDDIKRVLKLNPKHTGATFYAGKYCFQQGNLKMQKSSLNELCMILFMAQKLMLF